MLRKLLTPLIAVTLLLGVAGCSATAPVEAVPPAAVVAENTIVLDVRTPAEYAAGHLQGAVLLDLSSGEFASALPSLDLNADYVVYCRSGNRSGQAVSMMVQQGATNVTDLGPIENAAAVTGLAIVTD